MTSATSPDRSEVSQETPARRGESNGSAMYDLDYRQVVANRMGETTFRLAQEADVYAPHVESINRYVDELRRSERGWVPYVAPLHGGANARVLSVLRDPGPATQAGTGSGMLCIENADASAALQCALLEHADLLAADLTPWNAYPWYINRSPRTTELEAGLPTIVRMIEMMPDLRVVLLQGSDAQRSWRMLKRRHPRLIAERHLLAVETYHPSPQALFTPDPIEQRRRVERRFEAFEEVAQMLGR